MQWTWYRMWTIWNVFAVVSARKYARPGPSFLDVFKEMLEKSKERLLPYTRI